MKDFLANLILIVHFIYVSYVVLGLLYIWIGYLFSWKSIRNAIFRWTHLGAIGIVALEVLLGIFCPLTEWEASLRQAAGESFEYPNGFIAFWVHKILFYDWPQWVFTGLYILFFIVVLLTMILVPPAGKRNNRNTAGKLQR